MRASLWLGLVALLAGAADPPSAAADAYWQQVAKGDTRKRDRAVEEGNLHLREARGRRSLLDRGLNPRGGGFDPARAALAAFERALAIGPEETDIHYRALMAAELIVDVPVDPCRTCRDGYEAVVRHIDAIRRLDPNDTRDTQYGWQLAVVLSKLGALGGPEADGHFLRAVREYERWRRMVVDTDMMGLSKLVSTSYGNEAELLMAVGKLDEAIAMYQEAVELDPIEPLGYFGLAVAYDRDGQWDKAVSTMREGLSRQPGIQKLDGTDVFFVPDGDKWYYHALAQQVMGAPPDVTASWYQRYLSSATESKYHARAREHLQELGQTTVGSPAGRGVGSRRRDLGGDPRTAK